MIELQEAPGARRDQVDREIAALEERLRPQGLSEEERESVILNPAVDV